MSYRCSPVMLSMKPSVENKMTVDLHAVFGQNVSLTEVRKLL